MDSTQLMAMPPLKRIAVAPDRAVGAESHILRSELSSLRRAESRLDALRQREVAGQTAVDVKVEVPRVPAVHFPAPAIRRPLPTSTSSSVPGFVFDLDLKRFFVAWALVCKEMRAYWRKRRDENSRRWLGSRSKALALWTFFGFLRQTVDRPLPVKPQKGLRVREKTTQTPGSFFSCSEKGICKILLDDREEDGLRTALMFNQIMGKSSGKLTMLAVMQEEEAKGLKFCFNAWKKCMKSKSLKNFKLKKQREIFRAWLEILLMDQHDRALERLESTGGQLRQSQKALQRRIDQCERVKVKVEKVHLLRLDFFMTLVLQSWRMSGLYRKEEEEGKRNARRALAMSSLKLSESMAKKTTAFVKPHFQAWGHRTKHGKKVQRAAQSTISTMLGGSLSLVFNAWKMMKMSDFQMVQAQLNRREREFSELQEISQSFFSFSQENVERLKNMEAALQSADRALQIGAARGDSLECELRKLRESLKHHAEDAGSRGLQLKEDLERKSLEEMKLLTESTEKVKSELFASREMEARLQKQWHQMSEGDMEESEGVLKLRRQLQEAQEEVELLRGQQRQQAERLRSSQALQHSEEQALKLAQEAAKEAEEAALQAEEMAKLEELAAEAAQQRWTAVMESSRPEPHLSPRSVSELPAASTATLASPEELRRASPQRLGPGISTQTSMPPLEHVGRSRPPEVQQRYNDAWRPRGRNLIDTTEDLMTFDLACNVLSTGAYFKKKAGRRSSVKRYFFMGYGNSQTGFLKYFKDHGAAQAGQEARGAFDLIDLVRANWDGLQHSITLTQSTKKDSSERGLTDIPETFFHALLHAVHEAEFRRQYPEHGG